MGVLQSIGIQSIRSRYCYAVSFVFKAYDLNTDIKHQGCFELYYKHSFCGNLNTKIHKISIFKHDTLHRLSVFQYISIENLFPLNEKKNNSIYFSMHNYAFLLFHIQEALKTTHTTTPLSQDTVSCSPKYFSSKNISSPQVFSPLLS